MRQQPIKVSEYAEIEINNVDKKIIAAINRSFSKYVNVSRKLLEDVYILKTSHYIGRFSVGDFEVHINPKIAISRLFYMISKVYSLMNFYDRDVHLDTADDLIEHLLKILIKSVNRLLKQGLYASYITYLEKLNTIKGKVMLNTIAKRSWDLSRLDCLYDEYTHDVLENQLVRYAIYNASKIASLSKYHRKLKNIYKRFWNVSHKKLKGKDVDRVIFNRLNARYKNILMLCRFFLDFTGLNECVGNNLIRSFFVDMNRIFESYSTAVLKEGLGNSFDVIDQATFDFIEEPRIAIRPDVLIKKGNEIVLVIDFKYKKTEEPSQADIYQMNAYSDRFKVPVIVVYPSKEIEEREYVLPNGLPVYVIGLDLEKDDIIQEEQEFCNKIRNFLSVEPHPLHHLFF